MFTQRSSPCILLALLVLALALHAGSVGLTLIPATETTVTTSEIVLTRLWFANTTASEVTVTLKDRTTNCNSAACQFWPAVRLDPHSVQALDYPGLVLPHGFTWQASAANAVVAQAFWR